MEDDDRQKTRAPGPGTIALLFINEPWIQHIYRLSSSNSMDSWSARCKRSFLDFISSNAFQPWHTKNPTY